MLKITNISVCSGQHKILINLSLSVEQGSLHVLMGPNGSGKSTLASAIMGHPSYTVTKGDIEFEGNDITQLTPDKRARLGIFLAFQHPCVIPGVTAMTFLKEAYQAITEEHIGIDEFMVLVNQACTVLGVEPAILNRPLNEGFSGGEKKRLEMIQLLVLRPRLAILDEIDSGLDIDALKMVAAALAYARQHNPAMSVVIITHYQRILHYMNPDKVHVVYGGKIVASGGLELVQRVESEGYVQVSMHPKTQVGGHAGR